MPLTLFLFHYVKEVNKCSENREFNFDDWIKYLDLLNKISDKNGMKDLEFYEMPDNKDEKKSLG